MLRRPSAPLGCEVFRLGGKDQISDFFHQKNYGVGCPGGVEVVAHSSRDTLRRHSESDLGLLKIDFSNAFNQVSRDAFMQATCGEFPGLANWTNWCYGEESFLLMTIENALRPVLESNRVTLWAHFTSASPSIPSLRSLSSRDRRGYS